MVSLWLLGGLSGVLSTCVSLVHGSSMPLTVGACNSSFSTLVTYCGVAANTAGFNRGVYCSLLKFGVTADSLSGSTCRRHTVLGATLTSYDKGPE